MALNVLIVDDSPAMRNFVGRVLVLSGVELVKRYDASDGNEALKIMRSNSIDVVLTDINMPGMNGEEFVRNLHEDSALNAVPVIVISTDGTEGRVQRMRDLGAKGYLEKPFRPEVLRAEILRVLEVTQ